MSTRPALGLQVDLEDVDGRWISVGVLSNSDDVTEFSSYSTYWDRGNRPVLGQVFEQEGRSWHPASSGALPTWFSNLLPEGALRQAIAQDAGVKEEREFFLLSRIGGEDLPGAVRVAPVSLEGTTPSPRRALEVDGIEETNSRAFKFSLAGVQLKFSVSARDRSLTVPMRGESGTWIAKLPDRRPGFDGVPEAEFAALELARASGIAVPETRLIDAEDIAGLPDWAIRGGGKAFLIKRFDRRPEGRVHVEELAQVLNLRPSRKYGKANFETVARTTAALVSPEAVAEVIDRIVLNVLIGNGDAHVKNWAYTYPDGRRARLAPAYDIVPTVLFVPDDDMGLNLNGSQSFDDVDFFAFERLAVKSGWEGALGRQRAVEAAERVVDAWSVLVENLSRDRGELLTKRRDRLRRLLP